MKVKELKTIIDKLPDEIEIIVDGYEGGYCAVTEARVCDTYWNYDKERSYQGEHEILQPEHPGMSDSPKPGAKKIKALYVG